MQASLPRGLQDSDVSYLTPDLAAVLNKGEAIRNDQGAQPEQLNLLRGMLEDLVIDWARFKGWPAPKSGISQLHAALERPEC